MTAKDVTNFRLHHGIRCSLFSHLAKAASNYPSKERSLLALQAARRSSSAWKCLQYVASSFKL